MLSTRFCGFNDDLRDTIVHFKGSSMVSLLECSTAMLGNVGLFSSGKVISLLHLQNIIAPLVHYET